ncbi:superoxide dismutase family protein [uncultured Albimonas sp.]|uniref:superoxide dismutase family protein n=1 Tax=uncultured Albimonas sp. TaxID=1331701 RepID=UPI0030EDB60A
MLYGEFPLPLPGAPAPRRNPAAPPRQSIGAWLGLTVLALLLPGLVHAAEGDRVRGDIAGANPAGVSGPQVEGTVSMEETASGVMLVAIEVSGLEPGRHVVHVHRTGECDAEGGFKSAGGHLAADREHGVRNAPGPHPGDLPNLHAGDDGRAAVEYFAHGLSLTPGAETSVLDEDGAALVIHAGADDYRSAPAGAAGDRVACAVLEPTGA